MISRDAGDARRDRGHQQRRGQRKAAAGHVAADARERLDALLDDDAGPRTCSASPSASAPRATRAMCAGGRADRRAARPARRAAAPRCDLVARRPRAGRLERGRTGARSATSARSPPRADASTMPRHAPLERAVVVGRDRRRQQAARARARCPQASTIFSDRLRPSSLAYMHDLVQRVLDDALAPRRLEPRDQVAHRALLDDRVDRDPVVVAQRARSSAAAAPAAAPSTAARSSRRTFSIRPTRPCASIAAFSSSAMFSSFVALPRIGQRVAVGDQLRVRLHHRVDDAQPVGAQRRSGLGRLDDARRRAPAA